jgi:hypothetical protein
MALELQGELHSFLAAADLSAKQYYAVTYGSGGTVAVSTAGAATLGILQNNPASGKSASVQRTGRSKAKLSASQNIAKGDLLEVDTGGTLIKKASGTAIAQALEASNVAAIVTIGVLLLPSNAAF